MTVSHCSSEVSESVASHSTPAFRTTMSRPPRCCDGGVDRGAHRRGVECVGAHEARARALSDGFATRLVAAREDDARPVLRQPGDDRLADARRAARDKRPLVGMSLHRGN